MRRLRHRFVRAWPGVALRRVAPVGLAAALAGCAATSPLDRATLADSETGSARVAMRGEAHISGLPLLRGVTHRAKAPADPYSPFSGARPPYRLAGASWPWSPAEEDAIIAEAITAHEMRRP
jgi:hypothetical protein